MAVPVGRTRERCHAVHLTPDEVTALIEAAKGNRYGQVPITRAAGSCDRVKSGAEPATPVALTNDQTMTLGNLRATPRVALVRSAAGAGVRPNRAAEGFKEANDVKALSVHQWLEHSDGVGPRPGRVVFLLLRRNLESPFGFFAPSRLGFNLAWLTLVYLSFQLLSIPLAMGTRQRFIGVVDGMASLIPLGIALVVIFGKPELLGTPERWEAAFLLLFIAAIDLFGGYMFNIALSRRTMDVAGSMAS
jgi:hypothetical protein